MVRFRFQGYLLSDCGQSFVKEHSKTLKTLSPFCTTNIHSHKHLHTHTEKQAHILKVNTTSNRVSKSLLLYFLLSFANKKCMDLSNGFAEFQFCFILLPTLKQFYSSHFNKHSNLVITNSTGQSILAPFNRDIFITVSICVVKQLITMIVLTDL